MLMAWAFNIWINDQSYYSLKKKDITPIMRKPRGENNCETKKWRSADN